MNITKLLLILIVSLSITSCASSFRAIHPDQLEFINSTESQDVKLEYQYNLLEKNYAAKSKRKGEHLVAVKITNNSDRALSWNDNFTLNFENGNEVYKTGSEQLYNTLRQKPFSYIAYAPLALISVEVKRNRTIIPAGLIAAIGIISSNGIKAKRANQLFKLNLDKYFLYDSVIQPGEVKYGFIGLKTENLSPLKFAID